jgi:hypothetical protein
MQPPFSCVRPPIPGDEVFSSARIAVIVSGLRLTFSRFRLNALNVAAGIRNRAGRLYIEKSRTQEQAPVYG